MLRSDLLPRPLQGSFTACRLAGCVTWQRSAVTAAPTSAACPGSWCRRSSAPVLRIPSSCWTKSTSSGTTFGVTQRPHCWRCAWWQGLFVHVAELAVTW